MFCFNDDHLVTLPLATNNECSPLERLIINHHCSLNGLESLISYTPELHQLTIHQTDSNITTLQSIALINLVFIYLHMCKTSFYELKTFLFNISSTLKILSINCSEKIIFLDAHRWKQFISYYYPQLEKCYFTYYDRMNNDNQYEIYPGQINQFSSTFWIERKWIFHVKIDDTDIKYMIYPYKKTWYDYIDDKNIEYSTSTSLMLAIDLNPFYLEMLFERIKRVLTITQMHHLEIIEEHLVPAYIEELDDEYFHTSSITRIHINKVYLQVFSSMEDFNFIMALFPVTIYLQVGYLNNMNIELFVRNILKKINNECNDHLRLLCCHVPALDD
ncbi:unnamed protein product [Rotaria sp. Silwood2]|nr:unnamed protein product [Rotaria sp. Silwood2]CAF4265154.1 unnamed protein product [Rotaria sp. Silwood2]CAF4614165.1 unnamed protein product [Rotaria sp. Silwood2]